MGLRDQLRRLRRDAQEGAVLIRLQDGSTRVFDDMTCMKAMFLARTNLFHGEAHESEVLDAVRAATPESRSAFEAQYGEIEKEARIVCHESRGGWVRVHKLLEDGTVETTFHEGHTEEARRLREEARSAGPAF
jgi:hypothetical protein